MLQNFEEFEHENFSDYEIFTKIWSKPYSVLRFIHTKQYEKNMYLILFLIGVVNAFDRASLRNMGDTKSLTEIIVGSIIVGGLLGWISFYFYSFLVSWAGLMLKGKGDRESLYRVFTYSMIPAIGNIILTFIQIIFFGGDAFTSDFDNEFGDYATAFIFYSLAMASLGLGIYSIILCVIGTSIVQNFSFGRALLNLLLPIIFIVIIFGGIYLLFDLLS